MPNYPKRLVKLQVFFEDHWIPVALVVFAIALPLFCWLFCDREQFSKLFSRLLATRLLYFWAVLPAYLGYLYFRRCGGGGCNRR